MLFEVNHVQGPPRTIRTIPVVENTPPEKKSLFGLFDGVTQLFKSALPKPLTARALYEPTVEKMGENRLNAVRKTLQEQFPENSAADADKQQLQAHQNAILDNLAALLALIPNSKEPLTEQQTQLLKEFKLLVGNLHCGKDIWLGLNKTDSESVRTALADLEENLGEISLEAKDSKVEKLSFATAPQAVFFTQTLNSLKKTMLASFRDESITLENVGELPVLQRQHITNAIWNLSTLATNEEIKTFLIENWPSDKSFPYNEANFQLQWRRYKKIHVSLLDNAQHLAINAEVDKLSRIVVEIRSLLYSPPKNGYHAHMQMVREKINQALLCPAYGFCKQDESNACVHFLHLAAYHMNMQSEGMGAIENHGKELIEKLAPQLAGKDKYTCGDLASILDEVRKNHPGFKRDHKSGVIAWSAAHPEKCMAAVKGKLKPWALDYNSYKDGNANIWVGAFKVDGVNINFSLGPTPTGDKLYEAYLQFLTNKGEAIHLQQTFENNGIGGEKQRRLQLKSIASQFEKNNWLMAMPLDGKAWKSRKEFKDVASNEDYYLKLAKLAVFDDASRPEESLEEVFAASAAAFSDPLTGEAPKFSEMPNDPHEDNGFFIPEKVMSPKEVRNLFMGAKFAFDNLEEKGNMKVDSHLHELRLLGEKGEKRLNKARLLNLDLFLAIQGLYNLGQEMKGKNGNGVDASLIQACKQDVDRGVLMNILTIIATQKGELSPEMIEQIVGLAFIRAEMVDDRVAVESRFQAMSDLLHLIGDDLDGYLGFLNLFSSNSKKALEFEFIPSHTAKVPEQA